MLPLIVYLLTKVDNINHKSCIVYEASNLTRASIIKPNE